MKPFVLASREEKADSTIIKIPAPAGEVWIGDGHCTVIAGPCAVESEAQYLASARIVRELGAHILRGGAFKPRTSPYSFAGLGQAALEILRQARGETGLPVVTEVLDIRDLDPVLEVADIIQIGSRNMQNFSLLQEVAKLKTPVILKRGFAATLEEWLLAAEYIMAGGNQQVILCERGIRTFESYTRNTVDIGAVPLLKELTHLPVIVDPSHATGKWQLVRPVAKAAVAAGADGLMIEVHPQPESALSDGKQSLTPANFERLMAEVRAIAGVEGKEL
jgi:3-deoxy-7-phosphoheptulonate synthase